MKQTPESDADDLTRRVGRVRLLLLDVDGVLTDGSIVYTDDGVELKRFHVRDGSGIKLWRKAGHDVAILSGRTSAATSRRAAELGIGTVVQGREDKVAGLAEVLGLTGVDASDVCAVGDDLADYPVLSACGVGIAVADACPELVDVADHVTELPGGRGAVRAAVEWLLRRQGRWDELAGRDRVSG